MASRLARLAALAPVVLAVTVAPPAGPAVAAGLPGACPDSDGVTVVVDFQALGGQTIVRCAPGTQPTGLAALKNAGIDVTGTARWGEAFICRIEGRPDADAESCIDTPPASAYWSYWHASDGGSWTYSQFGATYRTPPPGSFEGWSFALDATAGGAPPPRVAPRRPPAPEQPAPERPAPEQPEQPAPPQPTAPPPAGSPTGDGRAGAPGAAADVPRAPGSPQRATTPAPASTTAAATTGPPGTPPRISSDVDAAASRSPAGVPVGPAVGLGLLLVLLVAAGLTARRRRASG